MKNHTKFEEWHHIIASREGTFVSPIMEKAAQYLRNARNEEGGWGYYKGLPTDIHASSLAIEALRINKGRELETSAEDAAVHIKTIISCNLDTLGIQQIVDLLNILSGTKPRDSELESKVVARLKDLRHDAGWGEPEPSITLSCGVILAFLKLENPPQDVIKQWVDYLAQCQRSDDGGWGATPNSKSAIIPTSRALRVLNCFSDKSLAETRSASIEFFRNYFQTKDWNELGDTFTISTVLRALSEIEEFSFEIVQAGIGSLYERVNSDGGWGPVKGEPSNIEHTALSMIALSSVGENKFVPSRLVNATLETAEAKIMQLRNERDRLLEDVDQRVQKELKNIIYERNELQKKVDHYKEEVSHLEANVREMKFELRDVKAKREFIAQKSKYEPGVRWKSNINGIVIRVAFFLSAIVIIGTYFFLIGNTTLFLTTVIVSVSGLLTYLFILWRNQLRFRRYRLELRPERHFIVSKLIDLLAEWPPSKREDFLFQLTRLTREGGEVSLDKLEDRSMYLSRKYVERESQYRRLQEIMDILMRLPPSARMAVIDELRGIFHET